MISLAAVANNDPARAERAQALLDRGAVVPISFGRYLVRSESRNVDYTVSSDLAGCTCPDRHSPCKHAIACRLYVQRQRLTAGRQRVIIDEYDPATGRVLRWHNA